MDVFRSACSSPATVLEYVRDSRCMLTWCTSLKKAINELDYFDVASFLRDQVPRGISVARRVFRAVVWLEKATDANCLRTILR